MQYGASARALRAPHAKRLGCYRWSPRGGTVLAPPVPQAWLTRCWTLTALRRFEPCAFALMPWREARRVGTIDVAQSSYWYGMGPQGAEGRAHPASEARNRRARRGSATRGRMVRTRRETRCKPVARDRFCRTGDTQSSAANDRTPSELARSSSWVSDAESHGRRQGGTPPRRAIDAPGKETTRQQRSVGLTLTTVTSARLPARPWCARWRPRSRAALEETLTTPALPQRDFMPLLGLTPRRTSEQTVHIGHTE